LDYEFNQAKQLFLNLLPLLHLNFEVVWIEMAELMMEAKDLSLVTLREVV